MPHQTKFQMQAPKIAMIMRARWAKEKARADLLQLRSDKKDAELTATLDALDLVLIGRAPCSICEGDSCCAQDPSRCYCIFPHRFRFDGSEGVT